MLAAILSGETAVLGSGRSGAALAIADGSVGPLLTAARRGDFKFKSAEVDASREVDGPDNLAVMNQVGTSIFEADLDFGGTLNGTDVEIVVDEIVNGASLVMSPHAIRIPRIGRPTLL